MKNEIENKLIVVDSVESLTKQFKKKNGMILFYSSIYYILIPNNEIVCLNCLINRLKINKEYAHLFSESSDVIISESELSLLQSISDRQVWNKNQVLIIDSTNFQIFPIHITKLDDCRCTVSQYKLEKNKKNEDIVASTSLRAKNSFEIDLFNKHVDRYAGLFKMQFINANSNLIPMIGTVLYFGENHKEFVGGFGRNFNLDKARLVSFLEAYERYYTSCDRTATSYIHSSFKKMIENNNDIITIEDLARLFPNNLIDEEKNYSWLSVDVYGKKEKKYILRQIIEYYDKNYDLAHERFFFNTSSGSSLGGTLEEAILYGLFELVERDAFLIHWQGKITPDQVDISTIFDAEIQKMIDSLEIEGYKVKLFDISTEVGIPVIWTYLEGDIEIMETVFSSFSAAGAHLNFLKAIKASLVEAMSSLGVYSTMLNNDIEKEYIKELAYGTKMVKDMDDHLKLYAHILTRKHFDFIDEARSLPVDYFIEKYRFEEFEQDKISITKILDIIVNRFESYFGSLYYFNFDNINLKKMDLYAVRVFSPKLLPMTFGNENAVYSKDRIKEFTDFKNIPWDGEINKVPHPFP